MKKRIFFCTSLIVFIISNSVCAYYNVIDLGTLGGDSSCAYSVNDNGQIVGSADNSSNIERACLFGSTGGGANKDLKTLGGSKSRALSINDNDQIVGWAYNGSDNQRACLFDTTGNGANINVGKCPGAGEVSSLAHSINNGGQIVGAAVGCACRFDPIGDGNNTQLLGVHPSTSIVLWIWPKWEEPTPNSAALSINNSGQIAGLQDIAKPPPAGAGSYYRGACLFVNNAPWYNKLSDNPSSARSINNNGQVVGDTTIIVDPLPFYSFKHAYLFDSTGDGNNIDLGTLGGCDNSMAYAINDSNQVVGYAYNIPAPSLPPSPSLACLFDPTGGGNNIDLNTLIDPSSGWILNCAYDINNDGWIVGGGINPDGDYHAFLLVIPEPTTMILLALGGMFLRKSYR